METFEQYYTRLKTRRDKDEYLYTDADLENLAGYIKDCYESGITPYLCLEMMYYAKRNNEEQYVQLK